MGLVILLLRKKKNNIQQNDSEKKSKTSPELSARDVLLFLFPFLLRMSAGSGQKYLKNETDTQKPYTIAEHASNLVVFSIQYSALNESNKEKEKKKKRTQTHDVMIPSMQSFI